MILVVGSAVMDQIVQVDRFPIPGETTLARSLETFPGGKGANQAVAIGKLGGSVEFLGCIGKDANGDSLIESLTSSGVRRSYLQRTDLAPTGSAMIFVDDSGQNMIAISPGATRHIDPAHVENTISKLKPSYMLCQLEVAPEVVEACTGAERLVLNPAPAREVPRHVLERTYLVTPNQVEAEQLTGILPQDDISYNTAAEWFFDRGVQNVVITLGENGAYWNDGAKSGHVAAPKVNAIDTVGAGDAFSGALTLFLSENYDFERAVGCACVAASISTTRSGAQQSMPTLDEVNRFLNLVST